MTARQDKAYGRKWNKAHRAGKPTADITRGWLATLRGPDKNARFRNVSGVGVITCGYSTTIGMSGFAAPIYFDLEPRAKRFLPFCRDFFTVNDEVP